MRLIPIIPSCRKFVLLAVSIFVSLPIQGGGSDYDSIKLVVEGRAITNNEIEIEVFRELQRLKLSSTDQAKTKEIRKKVVNALIDDALLTARASELRIYISEETIDNDIDDFLRQRKLTQADFAEILDRENITLPTYRKKIENRLKKSRVLSREVRSKIEVTEEQLKALYDSQQESYIEVNARHILKAVESNASKEQEEKIRQEIVWIKDRIQEGKPFEEMADKYSDDPSVASNHGGLGYFKREDIVKEISDLAFQLPVNQLSDPVRSPFGYHLVEVLDKKREIKAPFEEMRNELYRQIARKEYSQKLKVYLDKLKKKASIVFY